MPRKLCDFTAVQGLADQVTATRGKLQEDMDTWMRTAGITAQDWQDNAGGRFTEVNTALSQVHQALDEMQAATVTATVQAVGENAATVARSASRFA